MRVSKLVERVLTAAEDIGIPMTDKRLQAYGVHIRGIAADLDEMPESARAAIEYAVLGTAIYEPVIAPMRRPAHQDLGKKMFDQQKGDSNDR